MLCSKGLDGGLDGKEVGKVNVQELEAAGALKESFFNAQGGL